MLIVAPPLFVGRAQLRLPLHPAEFEALLAAQSLAGDRDLWLGPKDQTRLSRHHFESLGPLPERRIALEQPLYSALVGPLAVALGDRGPILANAVALVLLLWSCCKPRGPAEPQFWWGLTYFLFCAYPVLVWRVNEAVLLGGGLYLVLHRWGEERPAASGLLLGLILPGHVWLAPVALALALRRPNRFRFALAAGAAALFAVLGMTEPGAPETGAELKPELAAASEAPVPERVLQWQTDALALPPETAASRPVLFLLGRIQGVVPYFLPWLIGLCGALGYERRQERLELALALLAGLVLSEVFAQRQAAGPAHAGLALLLPAFFRVSLPLTRLGGLVGLWLASSLFCSVLFLNPIHAASRPADPLTLWPHRLLPLEIGRLDPAVVPAFRIGGAWQAWLPGRDAWIGPQGELLVRGKRWGHVVLHGPIGHEPPQLVLRAPVALDLELRAGGAAARLDLEAERPVRIRLPRHALGPAGPGRRGVELLLRPSAGLVPRLETGRGDGVDYVGVTVSFSSGSAGGGTK